MLTTPRNSKPVGPGGNLQGNCRVTLIIRKLQTIFLLSGDGIKISAQATPFSSQMNYVSGRNTVFRPLSSPETEKNKRLKISYLTMEYKYFHILYTTKKMMLKNATIRKS